MRCSQIGKAGEGIPAIHFQQVSLHHAWRELLAQARLKPHLHINGVLLDSTDGTDHPKVKKHKVWFMQALKESLSSSLSTSSSRPSHLRTASRTTPLSASKSVEAHCRASSSARTAARRTSRSSLWQLETFQHKKYQGAGLMMGRGILYRLQCHCSANQCSVASAI